MVFGILNFRKPLKLICSKHPLRCASAPKWLWKFSCVPRIEIWPIYYDSVRNHAYHGSLSTEYRLNIMYHGVYHGEYGEYHVVYH